MFICTAMGLYSLLVYVLLYNMVHSQLLYLHPLHAESAGQGTASVARDSMDGAYRTDKTLTVQYNLWGQLLDPMKTVGIISKLSEQYFTARGCQSRLHHWKHIGEA